MRRLTLIGIIDEGVRRGKHHWSVTLEDANGRAQVAAYGSNAIEAEADACKTFVNRRIYTDAERAQLLASRDALNAALGG